MKNPHWIRQMKPPVAKLSLIPHLLSAINRGALIAFIPSHVMDPLAPRDRVIVVPHPHSGEMHAFSSTGKWKDHMALSEPVMFNRNVMTKAFFFPQVLYLVCAFVQHFYHPEFGFFIFIFPYPFKNMGKNIIHPQQIFHTHFHSTMSPESIYQQKLSIWTFSN